MRSARAMPTAVAMPCPSGPVDMSTPGVRSHSGCPGVSEPICRKRRISSMLRAYPARCRSPYRSMEACPLDSTKRSRSTHPGSAGLCFRKPRHKDSAILAMPRGAPGWPDPDFSMASMASARRALASSERVGIQPPAPVKPGRACPAGRFPHRSGNRFPTGRTCVAYRKQKYRANIPSLRSRAENGKALGKRRMAEKG